MAEYEGLGELLPNSIRYGISNKRAIVIWGIAYVICIAIYFIGLLAYFIIDDRLIATAAIFPSIVPSLILGVLYLGYALRMMTGLMEGGDTAPDVSGIGKMAVDGIKIGVIYMEGVILMLILFTPLIALLILSKESSLMAVFCLLYPIIILLCMLALVINIVQWAVFADTDSLLSGLNPLIALKLILGDLRYAAVALIAAIVLYIIVSIASMVLAIFVVTIILLPFLMIPFYSAFIYVLARFYQYAAIREPHGPPA